MEIKSPFSTWPVEAGLVLWDALTELKVPTQQKWFSCSFPKTCRIDFSLRQGRGLDGCVVGTVTTRGFCGSWTNTQGGFVGPTSLPFSQAGMHHWSVVHNVLGDVVTVTFSLITGPWLLDLDLCLCRFKRQEQCGPVKWQVGRKGKNHS